MQIPRIEYRYAADIIDDVDEIRPNSISTSLKKDWLQQCDQKIHNAVVVRHIIPGGMQPYIKPEEPGEDEPEPEEPHMMIPEPYGTEIYRNYLIAMIDRTNGDTARYNNDMIIYNSALEDWTRLVHRDFLPKPGPRFRI